MVRSAYADPNGTWRTNAFGTINVLESLQLLKSPCVAVLITSDKCYDNVESIWGYRENDALGGTDPYSASKAAAELAIRSYVRSFFPSDGVVHIGIGRAGNVIGGGDWAQDRVVPDCIRAWSCNETVQLRNPLATRPWQHVLEPLSGYLSLAMALKRKHKTTWGTLQFWSSCSAKPFCWRISCRDEQPLGASAMERCVCSAWRPHESGLLKLNCDKALHHLGWQAAWNFEVTVRETALWYKRFYENKTESITEFSLKQIGLR